MSFELPDDFKCPISLEIMTDPVILSSGHTFDRSSIQRWLDSGHRTCPITKLPLPEYPHLIPNHALRSLIANFTLVVPSKSQPLTRPTNPLQNPHNLVAVLKSPSSPPGFKHDTLSQLVKMSKTDLGFRRQLTESGAVAAVLTCVDSDDDCCMQVKALSLLLNLSLDDDNKVGLVAEGAISYVVAALRGGLPEVRAVAATLITSLAVVDVNKATIGAFPNAIRCLVALLRDGNGREKKEAATALYTVCLFPNNRKNAVECGAVPILAAIAENWGMARAVEVLGVLVKCKEGREEMKRLRGFVEVLVRLAKEGSERAVQYALFTLNCLCVYSGEICLLAKRKGVLEISVVLLEDDNEKIRSNASNLVQTLRGD